MSIFDTVSIDCPSCGTPVSYPLVHSVSADRRPDLRESILDGSFQRHACPTCKTEFRVEPEFVYMDLARRQYLGVWPASRRGAWRECAARTREVFDDALGARATAEAREIGSELDVRVVFGWFALVEKILARQAGIDDGTLEVAKLAVLRTQDETPLPGTRELRLVGDLDGDLLLEWLGAGEGGLPRTQLRVPRALIGDIERDAASWQAVRDDVAEGDVVDFQRELLAG